MTRSAVIHLPFLSELGSSTVFYGAAPTPGTSDINRDDIPLSDAEAREVMYRLDNEERRQAMAAAAERATYEKMNELRFKKDTKFVCEEASTLHKETLIGLADGVSQLSVAFRDELLPKKKAKSVLADAHKPVVTMDRIQKTFNRMFKFIADSVRRANKVFKDGTGAFDWENVDSLSTLLTELEEHITAAKLRDLFGAGCIDNYVNFVRKTEVLQDWWFRGGSSGRSANHTLGLGLGAFMGAERDSNALLAVTRQAKNPPSNVAFSPKMSKKTLSALSIRKFEKSRRISRIYGAAARQGVWPTKIKTCGEWDYFRTLMAQFDDYMQDSWVGFNCLDLAGADLKANQPKFADVIASSATFCSSVVVALNRLAGISVDAISGDASRMRSRLKAAVNSKNATASAYAENFQKHQVATNLGFWYGLEKVEDAFASMANVPKSNWKRSNKEQNLYNLGLVMHRNLNSIINSFEKIIEYYTIVNDSTTEGSLVGNANAMISEGRRYKALIESNRAEIDRTLASFTNLNTFLSINSLATLIDCRCDGFPMPPERFTSVQRALIAKYYNCGSR